MERFDIAIVGTGPAGLEAAITAKLRNKNILLLGSKELSSKIEKAHTVMNFLGLPEISGKDMQKAFLAHIEKMNIQITSERVNTIYAMGDYFSLQCNAEIFEARSVILACGMSNIKEFANEQNLLGRGVSYCATCDAALYKNKTAIVIAYSSKYETEAEFLSEMAKKVYYIPIYKDKVNLSAKIEVVKDSNVLDFEKVNNKMLLHLGSKQIEADGLFILRESIAPSQLVPGLLIENKHVKVNREMKTNIDGIFACGDITGSPYQYIKAAGEGNIAALSAVNYLTEN